MHLPDRIHEIESVIELRIHHWEMLDLRREFYNDSNLVDRRISFQ